MQGYDSVWQETGRDSGVVVFSKVELFIDKVEQFGICCNKVESCLVKVKLGTEKFCIFVVIVLMRI